jgi:hypothetical protein
MGITVGDMKRQLEVFNDDDELSFCGLDFYRLKRRGEGLVQVEFDQQVYKDSDGRVVIENWE